MVEKRVFCGVAVSCGPQSATVKKSLARNVFVAKQRQSYCQNISHDTLRAAFVVENQRVMKTASPVCWSMTFTMGPRQIGHLRASGF